MFQFIVYQIGVRRQPDGARMSESHDDFTPQKEGHPVIPNPIQKRNHQLKKGMHLLCLWPKSLKITHKFASNKNNHPLFGSLKTSPPCLWKKGFIYEGQEQKSSPPPPHPQVCLPREGWFNIKEATTEKGSNSGRINFFFSPTNKNPINFCFPSKTPSEINMFFQPKKRPSLEQSPFFLVAI